MTERTRRRSLPIMAILVFYYLSYCIPKACTASSVLELTDPNNAHWGEITYLEQPAYTEIIDGYLRITTHSGSNGVSFACLGHIECFDLPTFGDVLSVSMTIETSSVSAWGNGMFVYPAVYQEGRWYVAQGQLSGSSTQWHTMTFAGPENLGFVANDFNQVYPLDTASHPDFSRFAPTLYFGFIVNNAASYDYQARYDNWTFTVIYEPVLPALHFDIPDTVGFGLCKVNHSYQKLFSCTNIGTGMLRVYLVLLEPVQPVSIVVDNASYKNVLLLIPEGQARTFGLECAPTQELWVKTGLLYYGNYAYGGKVSVVSAYGVMDYPSLVSAECSVNPSTSSPGSVVSVSYGIEWPESYYWSSIPVALGCSISDSTQAYWLNDEEHDTIVQIPQGYTSVSRQFAIPSTVAPGNYNVWYALRDERFEWPAYSDVIRQNLVVGPNPNTAPTAAPQEVCGLASCIYAGGAYTVTAKYRDPDGASDLKYCDLRIRQTEGDHNNVTLRWDSTKTSGDPFYPWAGDMGADYVEYLTATRTPLTDGLGYQIDWTFALNRTWNVSSGGVRFAVNAEDGLGLSSGWQLGDAPCSYRLPIPGITVLVHGYKIEGGIANAVEYWPAILYRGILSAFGGGEIWHYDRNTGRFVPDTAHPALTDSLYRPFAAGGHLVLVHDWLVASNDPVAGEAEAAGEALAAAMLSLERLPGQRCFEEGNPGAAPGVHFIGHSRGASVVSEAAQRLEALGFWIDYATSLDPHDFNDPPQYEAMYDHLFHDPAVQIWSRTRYADNYWRQRTGSPIAEVPNGRSLGHIAVGYGHDQDLSETMGFADNTLPYWCLVDCGSYAVPGHSMVVNYYAGTALPDSAEGAKTPGTIDFPAIWYNDHKGYDTGFRKWIAMGGYDANPSSGSWVRPGSSLADAGKYSGIIPYPQVNDGDRDYEHIGPANGDLALSVGQVGDYIAGWSSHFGGGGGGTVAQVDDKPVLVLRRDLKSTAAHTHNRFYVPMSATELHFRYGSDYGATDASLQITISDGANSGSRSLPLTAGADVLVNGWIALSPFRGKVVTAKFEVLNPETANQRVYIGDVVLWWGGETAIGDAPEVIANCFVSAMPNPFNPKTTIIYSLPNSGRVNLSVYDVKGARVAVLVDADLPAGQQSVDWAGVDDRGLPVPSGVYFARLQTASGVRTIKVTLAK